jgi:hypothetical protein
MNARQSAPRLAALLAAVAMGTISIGSQLGLARHYAGEADAVVASKRAAPLASAASATKAAAPSHQPRS